jgi:hypothetical protein
MVLCADFAALPKVVKVLCLSDLFFPRFLPALNAATVRTVQLWHVLHTQMLFPCRMVPHACL